MRILFLQKDYNFTRKYTVPESVFLDAKLAVVGGTMYYLGTFPKRIAAV